MAEMSIVEIKEAIRLAECSGDNATAEQLRKRLQALSINS